MKPIIVVSKYLVFPGYKGWAFFPFIFFKDDTYQEHNLRHEKIHIAQQIEMLVLPFYVVYILNFIWNLIRMKNNPYRNIIFEREAYANEYEKEYLEKRKFWAWIK
jgi:hypothetical protein